MTASVERLPSRLFTWIAAVVLFLAVAVLILVYVVGPLGTTSQEGIAARHAERSIVFQGGRVNVPVRIEGAGLPTCTATAVRAGSAVVLVIDHSSSMGVGPGSPLEAAKAAGADFVTNLSISTGDDLIGAVQFDDGAQIINTVGQDATAAQQAISAISGGGGTAIHEGLKSAVQALTPPPTGKEPVIVLLSDGGSNAQAALTEAAAAKVAGIRIITVALGDADADLLRQIASDPDNDFYATADPSALQAIYQEIAAQVGPVVARNVTVSETFDVEHFEPADAATPATGRIDRRFGVLTTGGRQISYSLLARRIGWWQISPQPGILAYDDCNGRRVNQAMPPGPRVLVLFPLYCLLIPLLLCLAWLLFRLAHWYWRTYVWEPSLPPRGPRTFPERRKLPAPLAWPGPVTPWQPEPALVIGLGGSGRWVLTHLKRNLLDAGGGVLRDYVRLLALDTSAAEYVGGTERQVAFANTRLEPHETLVVTEENLDELIREIAQAPDGHSGELEQWFPARDYDQRLSATQRDLSRGTNGRRPMGRIAVFRNLKDGLDQSSLWARLTESVADVKAAAAERNAGYQRVRVVIVASLAGGFGSGSVIDVAYLARRACEAQGLRLADAEVSLLLVSNAPFDAQRDDVGDVLTHVNTRAALREIERFLLSRNRPFKMQYKMGESDAVLAGQARNILDDCWLLDGPRTYYSLASRETPPAQALFPMIADALMVLLDTRAQGAGEALGGLRRQVAGRTLSLQAQLGQGIFSSLGAFTWRLPMRDLVADLQVRFAQQLLALLLFGDQSADLNRTPEAADNKEAAGITPRSQALSFMAGRSGSGAAPLPLQLAFAIHLGEPLASRHELLIDVGLRSQKEGEPTYLEHEVADFTLYLQDAVWRLLNGGVGVSPALARAGKLAYAEAFLRDLGLLLEQIAATKGWERGHGRLPRWTPNVVKLLPVLLGRYARVAKRLLQQLELQERALRTAVYGDKRSADQATCVVEELANRAHEARDNLKLLQGVTTVRRYLLAEQDPQGAQRRKELLDMWYRAHFEPNLPRALEYVVWELPDSNNDAATVTLTLRTSDEEGIPLTKETLPDFARGLMRLGGHAGQAVWESAEAVRLLNAALEGVGGREAELTDIHRRSEAVLPYTGGGAAQDISESRFLWSPAVGTELDWSRAREALCAGLARQAVTRMDLLDGSDLFAVTSLELRDYVPTTAIERVAAVEQSYLRYYGLVRAVGIGAAYGGPRNPEPSAVFPAENRANRMFERQMLDMPERTAWLLSSTFVGALDDIKPMQLFLQAYAGELVRTDWNVDRSGRVCVLDLSAGQLDLTVPENAVWSVAEEVVGMQNFVLGSEDQRLSAQPEWAARVALLEATLANVDRATLEQRWDEFDRKYLNRVRSLDTYGLDDLVACARILVRREMGLL